MNVREKDPVEAVREISDGVGADAVLEAVGLTASFQQAMALTKAGGQLTLIGNSQKMVEIDMQDIVTRELNLRGTYASAGEFEDALDLMASGRIDVKALISDRRSLPEGAKVFDRLLGGEENLIKVILAT